MSNIFTKMFTNIGKKIKTVAKVSCLILMLASVIAGIIVIADGNYALVGVGLLIVGPVLMWIGSFMTYGFGELIEKVTEIAQNTASGKGNPATDKQKKLDQLLASGLITEEEYRNASTK